MSSNSNPQEEKRTEEISSEKSKEEEEKKGKIPMDCDSLPPPSGRPANQRPLLILSQNLLASYKSINLDYFKSKRLDGPGPFFNNGFDDSEGHYILFQGEEVMQRYTIIEMLGKGSFGVVAKAFDQKRQETVAMKFARNKSNFRTQAKWEVDFLLKTNNAPGLRGLVVQVLKCFDWQGHIVLVFEILSYNLYQLIKCTHFRGVSLDLTKKFFYQLGKVLKELHAMRPPIIHCDLKPENICLKEQTRSGIRVIDFGSACYGNKTVFKYIQSRYYRAPEVILGLPYDTAIDRWSLACVIFELHVGVPLFNGRTEHQQLWKMQSVLGPVPDELINNASKRDQFYRVVSPETSSGSKYELKPVPNTGKDASFEYPKENKTLQKLMSPTEEKRKGSVGHEPETYFEFLDLLTKLLMYDPQKRIRCEEVVKHPFLATLLVAEMAQQKTAVEASSKSMGADSTENSAAGEEKQTGMGEHQLSTT